MGERNQQGGATTSGIHRRVSERMVNSSSQRMHSTMASPLTSPGSPGEESRQYLLVFEKNSTYVFPLDAHSEVVIGRAEDAGLCLRDRSVSRRHAMLSISASEVQVSDLGSRNGIRVNGDRVVGSRTLFSGDEVSVGALSFVFHSSGGGEGGGQLWELSPFRRRVKEELIRSLGFGREFGLLCVQIGETPDSQFAAAEVRQALRAIDVVARCGDGEVMALLPETNTTESSEIADLVMERLRKTAPEAKAGFANCPADGCDVDSLFASARTAANMAMAEKVGRAGEAYDTYQLGDREVIVADPAMKRVYALLERIAAAELPVLVCGETGTGKEMATQAIHARSQRSDKPLVSINCAAIQDSLIESELFGHEKGAFSGATATKRGRMEAANGGTLFLDEVGELSPAAQAKLLRVLDSGLVQRVGAVKDIPVDIRIVAATNRDLKEEVEAGNFRRDLFFRLSGAILWLPPLRDRRRELPILAQTMLREACEKIHREPLAISTTAMQILLTHDWPGNVRELKNLMEYVAAATEGTAVEAQLVQDRLAAMTSGSDDLPAMNPTPASTWPESSAPRAMSALSRRRNAARPTLPPPPESNQFERGATAREDDTGSGVSPEDTGSGVSPGEADIIFAPARATATPVSASAPAPPAPSPDPAHAALDWSDEQTDPNFELRPLADEIAALEKRRITQALQATGGNQTQAARLISVPLRTFVNKMKKYGIDPKEVCRK